MNTPSAGTQEVDFKSSSGYLALFFIFIALLAIPASIFVRSPLLIVLAVLVLVFLIKGIYMLQPNQSALMLLFGAPTTRRACAGRIPSSARRRSACACATSTARSSR
jgi:hypothetical protein